MPNIFNNKFFIFCGPNVIESEEHTLEMARQLKDIFSKYDIEFIFKISFDKANRSSINSYRGLGFDEGLRILKKVKQEVGVKIINASYDGTDPFFNINTQEDFAEAENA